MSKIFLLIFVSSCTQLPVRKMPPEGFVSGEAALNHIKASYLLGCVEAFKEMKMASFDHCRTKSEKHKSEIEDMMNQTPELK